jgi:hypothetical protein
LCGVKKGEKKKKERKKEREAPQNEGVWNSPD